MQIALFIFGTLLLIRLSWRALANPKSHGFYRFFAFEGLLVLLIRNQPYWFVEPFSLIHLLSWLLLFISVVFIIRSMVMLKRYGGHAERAMLPENYAFENTTHLVQEGPYRYIRHPMYSSLLFLAWGTFFKRMTALDFILALLVTAFLLASAKIEERENIQFFGEKYVDYMQRTKIFIPWVL